MFYSQPPSWYPDAKSRLRVDAARGAVRDALGGLRNLEQLSSSMRVGPRSLSSVLPDVLASCEPLRTGLEELLTAVAAHRLDTHLALNTLREYATPRINELSDLLTKAVHLPMQARNRLNLQHVVGRVARELGLVAELVDFLGLSVWSEPMAVTMQDLLLEAYRSSEPTGDPVDLRRVTLAPAPDEVELHTSPRAVIPLLVLLVRLMLDRHAGSVPHISLHSTDIGVSRVVITSSEGVGELRWVMGRPVIPAAREVLQTAANALDVKLEMSESLDNIVADFANTPQHSKND